MSYMGAKAPGVSVPGDTAEATQAFLTSSWKSAFYLSRQPQRPPRLKEGVGHGCHFFICPSDKEFTHILAPTRKCFKDH